MKHHFITTDGSMKARWLEAFPEASSTSAEQGSGTIGPGDVAWLVTTIDDWPLRVGELARRGAAVVVLSYSADDQEALLAFEQGARGYAHTLAAPEVLEQVALVVTNQGIWAGQALLSKVLGGSFQALQQRRAGEPTLSAPLLAQLTERERAVALAVARGASNKEIARQLDIGERTVKAHLSAIFKKLAVRDRLQLILKLSGDANSRTP